MAGLDDVLRRRGTADAFGQSRADLFELCVPLAEAIALAGKDGENRRVRGRCEWY